MSFDSTQSPDNRSFGRTLLWVTIAHFCVLAGIALLHFTHTPPSPPPLMEMISLPSTGPVTHSESHPHPAVEPPRPQPPQPVVRPPTPAVAQPTPPTPIAPTKIETPTVVNPPEAPSQIVLPPKPSPTVARTEPEPPATKPHEKPKHPKIEVNLKETSRAELVPSPKNTSSSPNQASSPSTEQPTSGPSESEVANRLSSALNQSGATTSIGPINISAPGVGSNSEFGAFFKVISDRMHEAWKTPQDLASFKKSTGIQIQVTADGTILDAKLISSSGNSRFDESALAAALSIGKLPVPRPEGCPEFITVNFRLAD